MNSYLNLFKALPVKHRTTSFSTDYINSGMLVEDSVISAYNKTKVKGFVKQVLPSNVQMNKTFHKSWKKVRDASMTQLVAEQIIHYFTTYGLESLGLYNKETVYIPNEQLDLEETGGITFYVLRGITADEIAERVNKIISSGVALSDQDLSDLVSVIKEQKLSVDPGTSNNREMTVRLYKLLSIAPKDPTEYLRLQIYLATNKTLLIKNKDTIDAIRNNVATNVFETYEYLYGLEKLASIFYRFKPLFLAFKNKKSASTINRIRRLANKHHKPMPEDYLASVTKHLRNGTLDINKLNASLSKSNVFRKIKLAQALRFYNDESAYGVVYSIRNGKSFATTINPIGNSANEAILATMDSLAEDLKELKGKKVYMDAELAVPTSGKMFCGNIPFGSHFSTKDSLVLGVSWKNNPSRVDLDLSMLSLGNKVGWDARYRDDNFLFSGDITDAPYGATEAHLVRKNARDGIYLLNLNYYSGWDDTVPFTLFVTKEDEYGRMNKNSMMSQDNMLFWSDSEICDSKRQKSIGILKIKNGIKTFYVFEAKVGNNISSTNDDKSVNTIGFYDKYLDSLISMRELLGWVGAEMVNDSESANIDLSLASLTKDRLVDLFSVGQKK